MRTILTHVRTFASTIITTLAIVVMGYLAYPSAQALMNSFGWASTGKLLMSSTAPTIAGGFGNTPSVLTNNGAASFRINVGTGTSAWSGTIGLPTASNQWNCQFTVENGGEQTKQTDSGSTSTHITVWNYGTGLTTTAWQVSDVIIGSCFAT